MSKISYIKSDDRKYNVSRALSLIKSEIMSGLKHAKRVVVKPNCVTDSVKLAATSAEALDAVLEFITPFTTSQIVVAEGCGLGDTLTAFKNFGYLNLQERYDFTIIDLNEDDFVEKIIHKNNGSEIKVKVAKTVLDSDYLISVTPPKTHNTVVFSGAIKNITVGPLLRSTSPLYSNFITAGAANSIGLNVNHKMMIHQGYKTTNQNIADLFGEIPLKLAVIDGFEGMEGEGPIDGDMVPSHFAIASSDPIAADWLTCQMMNIDTNNVGYLAQLIEKTNSDGSQYLIAGDDWQKNIIKFKMHSDFDKMKIWH